MAKTSDFIVIGSGAIGSCCAWNLAKRGYSVTVLEKSPVIGDGGSSRNGGGVRQSGRHPAELPLAMYAVKNLWPSLSEELGTEVEYCQKGNLRLGKTPAHLEILRNLTRQCQSGGLAMEMIDAKQAREINPYLSDDVIGAGWCPTDGHANPLLVTLAFYRAARRLGARYVSDARVLSLEKVRGRVARCVTKEETYEAGGIILAAGYDSRFLLDSVGLDAPLVPIRLECLVTEEAPPMFEQMLGTAMADFYGHQSRHGSFVFGGTHGFENTAVYDGSSSPEATPAAAPSMCRGIIGYFPCLQRLRVVRVWAGWMDDCADHIPVMSNPPETPGLTVGCGFSGHGFGISPVAGLLLAQLAAGEETVLPVDAFQFDRFMAKV